MQSDPGNLASVLSDPARLSRLNATELMDTPPDEEFDRLARLASKILRAPVALVSLVAEDRQFFKSCVGLPEPWRSWRQTPLSHSFCQHVVTTCQPLVISDAREDERVKHNLDVTDLGVIAYLGIPLKTPDGICLGSFCVVDTSPRQWSEDDIWMLQTLAYSVMSEIELRQHRNRLQAMVEARTTQLSTELDRSRKLQEQLHGALEGANAANEAKRRFIAALSHELRTPLTPVLLYASSAETSGQFPPEVQDVFKLIREQIELEVRLIEDLLNAADLGRGRVALVMDRLDLHALLGRIRGTFAVEAGTRRIAIDCLLEASRPVVRADSACLTRALSNVLGNAIKFSPPDSRVTVRTFDKADSPQDHPEICVEFIDHGIGMEADCLSHVFDGFWQKSSGLSRKYGGLGLGLMIARALVEMHGGALQVASEGKDRGATFTICLPAADVTHVPDGVLSEQCAVH